MEFCINSILCATPAVFTHTFLMDANQYIFEWPENPSAFSNSEVVSFAAVIGVVTQRFSPREALRDDPDNGCEGD